VGGEDSKGDEVQESSGLHVWGNSGRSARIRGGRKASKSVNWSWRVSLSF